jgi:putative acetyltransferase
VRLDPIPIIRPEASDDWPAVHRVNSAAFGRPDEADLVDSLRDEGVVLLSLVAEIGQCIAGHILFTRMWIDMAGTSLAAAALAPLAVTPEYQRQGIGGQLIRSGLENPFPPEDYMALELTPGALNGVRGRVRYPPAFKL